MGQETSKPTVELKDIPHFEDYYASMKAEGKVVHVHRTPEIKGEIKINSALNQKISLWRGDITSLAIDAIVNAANAKLYAGGGICGAIHRAAGPQLEYACEQIGGCPTGETVPTHAYRLPCKAVLHSVGPTSYRPDKLKSCYRTIMERCVENKIRSVAVCCISTGIFGYPNGPACVTALTTVREWLEEDPAHAAAIDRVIFCTFQKLDVQLYDTLCPIIFPVEPDNLTTERTADGKEPEPPKLVIAVGAFNDAYDGRSWLKSEILEINEEEKKCFITYTGYAKKYDEWMDYSAEGEALKLRPLTNKGGIKWKLEKRIPGAETETAAASIANADADAMTPAATMDTDTTTAATVTSSVEDNTAATTSADTTAAAADDERESSS